MEANAWLSASQAVLGGVAGALLALVFLDSAWQKLRDWPGGLAEVRALGLPWAPVALGGTIVLQAVGGLMLVSGWHARWAALALAAFTVAATAFGHAFWRPGQSGQRLRFLEHLAIVGGLLAVAAHG